MIFGAASFEIELRRIAGELAIDADALVDRWRRRSEVSIAAGRSQKWAQQEAFDHFVADARERRRVFDRIKRKR